MNEHIGIPKSGEVKFLSRGSWLSDGGFEDINIGSARVGGDADVCNRRSTGRKRRSTTARDRKSAFGSPGRARLDTGGPVGDGCIRV